MDLLTKEQDKKVCKTRVIAEFPKEELSWEKVTPILGRPDGRWFPSTVRWAQRIHVVLLLLTARWCCQPCCAGLRWAQEAGAAARAGQWRWQWQCPKQPEVAEEVVGLWLYGSGAQVAVCCGLDLYLSVFLKSSTNGYLFSFLFKLNVVDGILNCFYLKKQKQFYFAVRVPCLPASSKSFQGQHVVIDLAPRISLWMEKSSPVSSCPGHSCCDCPSFWGQQRSSCDLSGWHGSEDSLLWESLGWDRSARGAAGAERLSSFERLKSRSWAGLRIMVCASRPSGCFQDWLPVYLVPGTAGLCKGSELDVRQTSEPLCVGIHLFDIHSRHIKMCGPTAPQFGRISRQ